MPSEQLLSATKQDVNATKVNRQHAKPAVKRTSQLSPKSSPKPTTRGWAEHLFAKERHFVLGYN